MATSDRDAAPHGAAQPDTVTDDGFPTTLHLPDGFEPESVGIGTEPFAYFGSLADGSIYRVNLITGGGEIITAGSGSPSAGIKVDPHNRLWVAGAFSGEARVVDGNSGEVLATYQLATTRPTLVNDFVLTPDAAYATDSFTSVLYRLPFRTAGPLPTEDEVRRVPLTGEMVYREGFNANGIARTPDGAALLVMQSNTDTLFHVDPDTGMTHAVDLGGEVLDGGDGIHLTGRTLYVALGPVHQIAVIQLNAAGTSGRVVDRIGDPRFDLPTAVATYGRYLYVPNARFFSVPEPTPTTPYTAVAVALR
jgi:sugar lactone lactonase YvrE